MQGRQILGVLPQDLVVHGDCAGEAAEPTLPCGAQAEEADHVAIVSVVVEARCRLVATLVADGVLIALVAHMAEPLAASVLAYQRAEMLAEAPEQNLGVRIGDVVEREAAQ